MRAAIGVDVGGTSTKAGVVTADGTVVARTERPTDRAAASKGALQVVDDLVEQARRDAIGVSGVGLGAAGFVAGDSVIFSPNLVYDDPALALAVTTRTGLPAVVDNDANAAVWGERTFGSAHGIDDIALITLGTGFGSGFVVAGRLLRGHSGAAAELGHTVVDPSGPPCPCGLRGCAEQFVSGNAIARMAREGAASDPDSATVGLAGSAEAITAEHVARAARELDETARTVLRRAGVMLGAVLSNVANVFDPEVIVLAGGVTRAGEPLLGPARDELVRMTGAQRRRPMRLDVSTLGADAGILGAAALVLEPA
ncbi:MAG TPA: ROK family protein [Actinomycetota bacterium]|nr:ROK family protein [Actinomycetota bacterium]